MTHCLIHACIAFAYVSVDWYEQSETYLKKAIEIYELIEDGINSETEPFFIEYNIILGRIYSKRNEDILSKKHFCVVTNMERFANEADLHRVAEAYEELGSLYIKCADLKTGEQHYNHAYKIKTNESWANNNRQLNGELG